MSVTDIYSKVLLNVRDAGYDTTELRSLVQGSLGVLGLRVRPHGNARRFFSFVAWEKKITSTRYRINKIPNNQCKCHTYMWCCKHAKF